MLLHHRPTGQFICPKACRIVKPLLPIAVSPCDEVRLKRQQFVQGSLSPIGIKSFKKFLQPKRAAKPAQPNGAAAQPKRAAETIKGSGTSKRLLAPANGATILTREQTKEREQALTRELQQTLKGVALVSAKVKVFWPGMGRWYTATVMGYNSESKLHHLKYADGDEEHDNLDNGTADWQLVQAPEANQVPAAKKHSLVQAPEANQVPAAEKHKNTAVTTKPPGKPPHR